MTLEVRCPTHPSYRGVRKPRLDCLDCKKLYLNNLSDQWCLDLNRYQRDNLLFLLNLCGVSGSLEPNLSTMPFSLLNNGDWLAEILFMLGRPTGQGQFSFTVGDDDHPNTDVDTIRKQVNKWVNTQCPKETN